jgi:hypothetical protein
MSCCLTNCLACCFAAAGPQGKKGDQGDRGAAGKDGKDGAIGPMGLPGPGETSSHSCCLSAWCTNVCVLTILSTLENRAFTCGTLRDVQDS